MWSTGFEPFVRVKRVAFFISVSGNSVLKFYVANAERNFQVVNLFHSMICLLVAMMILSVFLLNLLMSFTTISFYGDSICVLVYLSAFVSVFFLLL